LRAPALHSGWEVISQTTTTPRERSTPEAQTPFPAGEKLFALTEAGESIGRGQKAEAAARKTGPSPLKEMR